MVDTKNRAAAAEKFARDVIKARATNLALNNLESIGQADQYSFTHAANMTVLEDGLMNYFAVGIANGQNNALDPVTQSYATQVDRLLNRYVPHTTQRNVDHDTVEERLSFLHAAANHLKAPKDRHNGQAIASKLNKIITGKNSVSPDDALILVLDLDKLRHRMKDAIQTGQSLFRNSQLDELSFVQLSRIREEAFVATENRRIRDPRLNPKIDNLLDGDENAKNLKHSRSGDAEQTAAAKRTSYRPILPAPARGPEQLQSMPLQALNPAPHGAPIHAPPAASLPLRQVDRNPDATTDYMNTLPSVRSTKNELEAASVLASFRTERTASAQARNLDSRPYNPRGDRGRG